MPIDLSRFKVIYYGEMVLNAVALTEVFFGITNDERETVEKPKIIDVLAINRDGNIISIRDEGWKFQFIPIVTE